MCKAVCEGMVSFNYRILPTLTDSLLAPGQEVGGRYKRYHHFCPCQEQEGPQARGTCSTFPRDHNKGFYSEKC